MKNILIIGTSSGIGRECYNLPYLDATKVAQMVKLCIDEKIKQIKILP